MLELLLAHRHLWDQRDEGSEDSWLFDTGSLPTEPLASKVMKLTFCRNLGALDYISTEQRKIEEFDNLYRRRHFVRSISREEGGYELVRSGEFRHLVLQQTRYNIVEHAEPTIGMSVARIFSLSDLQKDWGLSESEISEVASAVARARLKHGLSQLANQAKQLARSDATELVQRFGELGRRKFNLAA